MIKVFLSYSHKDEEMRNELESHLSILKRQNIIDLWHDRRIGAGKEFASEIDKHLLEADIILLLVSSYFLDSDYCYDIEMAKAIERHTNKEARVIPIILRPCAWLSAPFGKLLAIPPDGKPVSKYPDPHEAFYEITKAIEKVALEIKEAKGVTFESERHRADDTKKVLTGKVRSSNLGIKKEFTDRDKDKFLADAFEYIAKFFEGSLDELKTRNSGIDTDYRRVDANKFSASVYRNGSAVSRCTIRLSGGGFSANSIVYTIGDSESSINESMSVEEDGYQLSLKSLGFFTWGERKTLTYEGAAELYWSRLIEPLQR